MRKDVKFVQDNRRTAELQNSLLSKATILDSKKPEQIFIAITFQDFRQKLTVFMTSLNVHGH